MLEPTVQPARIPSGATHLVEVVHVNPDLSVVMTTDAFGRLVPCWCTEFTAARIPVDLTPREAARLFAAGIRESYPTAVIRRVRTAAAPLVVTA